MATQTDEEIFNEFLADLEAENQVFHDAIVRALSDADHQINDEFKSLQADMTEAIKNDDKVKIDELLSKIAKF